MVTHPSSNRLSCYCFGTRNGQGFRVYDVVFAREATIGLARVLNDVLHRAAMSMLVLLPPCLTQDPSANVCLVRCDGTNSRYVQAGERTLYH